MILNFLSGRNSNRNVCPISNHFLTSSGEYSVKVGGRWMNTSSREEVRVGMWVLFESYRRRLVEEGLLQGKGGKWLSTSWREEIRVGMCISWCRVWVATNVHSLKRGRSDYVFMVRYRSRPFNSQFLQKTDACVKAYVIAELTRLLTYALTRTYIRLALSQHSYNDSDTSFHTHWTMTIPGEITYMGIVGRIMFEADQSQW